MDRYLIRMNSSDSRGFYSTILRCWWSQKWASTRRGSQIGLQYLLIRCRVLSVTSRRLIVVLRIYQTGCRRRDTVRILPVDSALEILVRGFGKVRLLTSLHRHHLLALVGRADIDRGRCHFVAALAGEQVR